MVELKSCPFCGAKMLMTYNSGDNVYNFWHGDITDCPIDEPIKITGHYAKSLTEAAVAWNRRAADEH